MLNDLFASQAIADALEIVRTQFALALWETLYVTLAATLAAFLIGLPLGVLLVVGEPDGLLPLPKWLLRFLNVLINLLRSIPFLILMIMVFPLTRLIVGTAVGTTASIVPLSIAAFPFVSRLVESSLREIDPNILEMSRSMGASPMQTICRVMLPEALPSLVSNGTIAVTTILGYTPLATLVGGGGLGAIAVQYGLYRFRDAIMYTASIVLIILVQILQELGMKLAKSTDKRIRT